MRGAPAYRCAARHPKHGALRMIENDAQLAAPFDNLLDLRNEHQSLLEKQNDRDRRSSFAMIADDVRLFVGRARATGAILFARDERDYVQALTSYWSSLLFRVNVDVKSDLVQFDKSKAP